jgi:hypothetical protein
LFVEVFFSFTATAGTASRRLRAASLRAPRSQRLLFVTPAARREGR